MTLANLRQCVQPACIALFMLPAATAAARAPELARAHLAVSAPASCATESALRSRIHARSQAIQFVDDTAHDPIFQVDIRVRDAQQIDAELHVTWPDGRRSERRLRDTNCSQALDALALLIALTLDPSASSAATSQDAPADAGVAPAQENVPKPVHAGTRATRDTPPAPARPTKTPQPTAATVAARATSDGSPQPTAARATGGGAPQPTAATVAAAVDTPRPTAANVAATVDTPQPAAAGEASPAAAVATTGQGAVQPTAARSELWRVDHMAFGLSAELVGGAAPRPLAGLDGSFRVALGSVGLWAPLLQLEVAHAFSGAISEHGGRARFQLNVARLTVCAWAFELGPNTTRGCLAGDLGWLAARGEDTYSPASKTRAWASLGAALLDSVRLSQHVEIDVSAALTAPLRRDAYAFNPNVFYRVAALGFNLRLGLAWRFP